MSVLKKTMLCQLVCASLLYSSTALSDQYIVVSHHKHNSNAMATQLANVGESVTESLNKVGVAIVDSDNPDFIELALQLPAVKFAVKNVELGRDQLFTDSSSAMSSLSSETAADPFMSFQWNLQALQAPAAWDMGYRGTGVTVAVLDTGIDADNPELIGRVNTEQAKSFIANESWDAAPEATFHHGTIIATAMAAADNGFGIVGVAPSVEILPIKVASDDGSKSSAAALIQGMYYAVQQDADVINMSVGMHVDKSTQGLRAIKTAFRRIAKHAWRQGSLVIAAAGNDGINVSQSHDTVHLPAQLKKVVAISATGPVNYGKDQSVNLDQVPQFTNYGDYYVDFAAPGGNDTVYKQGLFESCQVSFVTFPCYMFDEVIAIDNNGQPLTTHGTSIAAAQASGVAALVIEKLGSNKPRKVLKRLIKGADEPENANLSPYFGFGRLNAANSVK